MISKKQVFQWILYAFILLFAFLLQTTLLSGLTLFGVHPLPVPVLVVCVSVFENPKQSAVYAFAAGLLCDAVIPPSEAFFSLFFLFAALLIGYVIKSLFRRNFITCALFSFGFLFLMDFFYFLFFYLFTAKAGFQALYTVALPEILFSLLFILPIYPAVRAVSRMTAKLRQ